MAAVEITISGVLYDKLSRTTQQVVLVGDASLTGLGIGGGPMPPTPGGPPGIWGPTDPRPQPPIAFPPGWVGGVPPGQPGGPVHIWGGGNEPFPTPPIVIPPEQVPPEMKPPTVPPPGTATAVPGNYPVAPIVPPEYVVMNYPGVGPLVVVPPPKAMPA